MELAVAVEDSDVGAGEADWDRWSKERDDDVGGDGLKSWNRYNRFREFRVNRSIGLVALYLGLQKQTAHE